ncbi:hypothetical protein CspeluHIS016_0501430 [Cutaneotrichosporon spelunceum]|uniref:CFEM domain-containing protein n=1 Tax=Cutaneotrichosporon spelunceum TaxID=1672016 RepID=A0AAD3TWY9_9TREE|nr:hypothetical protein CspeluHIS016_0501430 [Cutaneotrichosporon spelunceum]
MKLLALTALATLVTAELSSCITQCAQNVTATNATSCPSKDFDSQDCLCEYGFTSAVRKCMYTGCASEVNAWVNTYRGAGCPENTYAANATNPHANSTGSNSTGATGSGTTAAGASGSIASSPAATPSSKAAVVVVPVVGAAIAAAVVAAL